MADQNKIVYNIKVNAEQGTATIRDLKGQIVATQVPVDQLRGKFGNFASQVNAVKFDKFNKGLKSATAANKGLAGASGGATTSVLELGRVVSDAPYGIRGMANNVSQLASNMLFTAQQVDQTTGKVIGFSGVLKQMGKTFIGPLGILFAIQAVVAAVDYFYGAATKATSSASDYAESLVSLRKTMDDLKISQEDVNDKIEDYIVLSDLKNKLDKSQEESTERLKDIEEDLLSTRKEIANKTKLLYEGTTRDEYKNMSESEKIAHRRKVRVANFSRIAEDIERAILKETKLESDKRLVISQSLDIQKEYNDAKKKFNAAEEGTLQALKNAKKEKEKERELLSKTSEDYKRLTIAIDEYQKKIEEIEGKKKKGSGKVKKMSPFKTPKELDIDIKNVDKALLDYEKKTRDNRLKEELNNKLSQAKSEEERKLIRDAYAADRLESELKAEGDRLLLAKETEESIVKDKYNTHIAQLNNAKELYEFKIKNDPDIKNKEGLLKKLNSTHKSALQQAKDEFDVSMSEIQSNFELISVAFEDYSESRRNSLNSGDFGSGEEVDPLQARLDKTKEFAEKFNAISSYVTDFMDGEFQRQITMEQNKTNAINNELRERLNNENLSAGERKSIQLKIARNDEALRKKQEKIEKKRFKMQKAANISQALVATYLSAQKAYLSQLQLDPTSPIRAKIAAGVATAIGLGNVAMIARQKFQSSAGATVPAGALGSGGGSGSGTGDRSFNFNLAGASRENQLAQTLQGRFDQPLQAYVVSRDITNQQQLDLDIENNASFG